MDTTLAQFAPAPDTLSFDQESKCALITLEQLDKTLKMENYGGKLPKATPVEHSTLIIQMLEMADKHAGLTPTSQEITIREPNVRRIQWKGKNAECPLENYLVERIVTKIEFKDDISFADKEDARGTMAFAVSYTDRGGIQVAFGHNVHACQNMNIFGDYVWSTTGSDKYKVAYDKGMELYKGWLQNYGAAKELTNNRIQRLMGVEVDSPLRTRILGTLFERAVRSNQGDKTIEAPLNQADCAALVRAGYDRITEGKTITAWDLTNWATHVLKPERSDMASMILCNHKINEFIYEQVGLN